MRISTPQIIQILETLLWLKSGRTKDHKKAFKALLYLFNDATGGKYCNGYLDENDPKFKTRVNIILDTMR